MLQRIAIALLSIVASDENTALNLITFRVISTSYSFLEHYTFHILYLLMASSGYFCNYKVLSKKVLHDNNKQVKANVRKIKINNYILKMHHQC